MTYQLFVKKICLSIGLVHFGSIESIDKYLAILFKNSVNGTAFKY
jgi:hypothetical protein